MRVKKTGWKDGFTPFHISLHKRCILLQRKCTKTTQPFKGGASDIFWRNENRQLHQWGVVDHTVLVTIYVLVSI